MAHASDDRWQKQIGALWQLFCETCFAPGETPETETDGGQAFFLEIIALELAGASDDLEPIERGRLQLEAATMLHNATNLTTRLALDTAQEAAQAARGKP